MFGRLLMAALLIALSVEAARSDQRSFTFDGHVLTEHRRAVNVGDSFVEFTLQAKGSREVFVVRSIANRRVEDDLKRLVADIRSHNPGVKLRMFERSAGNDVMISYLLTPNKGDPSLVLWRLTQVASQVISATYQLDFSIDDEEGKDKVMNHTAEKAFMNLSATDMEKLVKSLQQSLDRRWEYLRNWNSWQDRQCRRGDDGRLPVTTDLCNLHEDGRWATPPNSSS